jgi:aminoglycoside 3-N-acetyltransferase
VLVLHSGYRVLGPVNGGPQAVVGALLDVLGPEGTLMAPTFTTQLTDPYCWAHPLAGEARERRMAAMEEFDPDHTDPRHMGAVATAVWRWPGARRSRHPVTSWAAIGPRADALLADHPLDDPEGMGGPLGKAHDADARILLVGVDHDADTTVHLAESRLEMPHLRELPDRYPTRDAAGNRIWRAVAKTTKCSDGFIALTPHLERDGVVRRGRLGDADVQLVRSQDVVRVATALLSREPTALLCRDPECMHCPTSRRVLAQWTPG